VRIAAQDAADHLRTAWDSASRNGARVGDSPGQPARPDRPVEILKLLWQGQPRHAGSPNSRRPTQVEAAMHLAAALVQRLSSAVLYRR
jgi:hypothetical protein